MSTEFGGRVEVRAVVQRCRGEVIRPPRSGLEPSFSSWPQQRRRDGGYLRAGPWWGDQGDADWSGEPIPADNGYLLEPSRESPAGIYIRLRRFTLWTDLEGKPVDKTTPGIVIGSTWRAEGRLIPTERLSGEYGAEVEQGCLLDQRRVPLLQVALEPIPGSAARVAFVWHEDVVS